MAFITLLERKALGLIGLRLGPNKASFAGILQPLSDALKLSGKQVNNLTNRSYLFYYFRSASIIFRALLVWSSLHMDPNLIYWKFSMVLLLSCLAYNSLNSILAGWRTFRKYSLIGTVRTVSQLVSYEAVFYLILFFSIYNYLRFNIRSWVLFCPLCMAITSPFIFYVWVPTVLAELNRTPFDFSEGERELVRGFNTEFGSRSFTLIFLAEYRNILFMSFLTGTIFFMDFKFMIFLASFFFIIWVRSVLPRFRFDKLMGLAWKVYIPLITLFLVLSLGWFY